MEQTENSVFELLKKAYIRARKDYVPHHPVCRGIVDTIKHLQLPDANLLIKKMVAMNDGQAEQTTVPAGARTNTFGRAVKRWDSSQDVKKKTVNQGQKKQSQQQPGVTQNPAAVDDPVLPKEVDTGTDFVNAVYDLPAKEIAEKFGKQGIIDNLLALGFDEKVDQALNARQLASLAKRLMVPKKTGK